MQTYIIRWLEEFPKKGGGFKEIVLTSLKQIIGNMIAYLACLFLGMKDDILKNIAIIPVEHFP